MTPDQTLLACWAGGVLIRVDPARKIPGIYKLQPGLLANLSRPDQYIDSGVLRIGHAVILVEGGDMPGDIRRYRDNKSGRIH